MNEGQRTGLVVVGGIAAVLGIGGALVAGGVIPNPLSPSPAAGAAVSIVSVNGPQGSIGLGDQQLQVTVKNIGTVATDIAVEAIIESIGQSPVILGRWFQDAHPAGGYPGGLADTPAWFQWRCTQVPVGGTCTAGFGTLFEAAPAGSIITVAFAAPVASSYTGPLVTGKRIGALATALVDAAAIRGVLATGEGAVFSVTG